MYQVEEASAWVVRCDAFEVFKETVNQAQNIGSLEMQVAKEIVVIKN